MLQMGSVRNARCADTRSLAGTLAALPAPSAETKAHIRPARNARLAEALGRRSIPLPRRIRPQP